MDRSVVEVSRLAKSLLRECRRLFLVGCVSFYDALTDIELAARVIDQILEGTYDVLGHLSCAPSLDQSGSPLRSVKQVSPGSMPLDTRRGLR